MSIVRLTWRAGHLFQPKKGSPLAARRGPVSQIKKHCFLRFPEKLWGKLKIFLRKKIFIVILNTIYTSLFLIPYSGKAGKIKNDQKKWKYFVANSIELRSSKNNKNCFYVFPFIQQKYKNKKICIKLYSQKCKNVKEKFIHFPSPYCVYFIYCTNVSELMNQFLHYDSVSNIH